MKKKHKHAIKNLAIACDALCEQVRGARQDAEHAISLNTSLSEEIRLIQNSIAELNKLFANGEKSLDGSLSGHLTLTSNRVSSLMNQRQSLTNRVMHLENKASQTSGSARLITGGL